MTTVSQLIEQVSSHLHNFTGTIEKTSYLTGSVDSSVLLFSVQHQLTQGLVEIDDELIHVETVGAASFTAMPFGRGVGGSTAAAHASGAKVVNDPQFPRIRLFDAIKRAILQIQPDLFAVTTTTIAWTPAQNTYDVPATVDNIMRVQYEAIGPSGEWVNVPAWSFDSKAAGATGKSITIYNALPAAVTVQITYAGPFTTPASTSTDLESTCGIPASMHDVLLWNVVAQLIPFADLVRMSLRGVEQQARAQGVGVGDAAKVAERMYLMYQRRLAEERKRLLKLHPPVKHYTPR